MCSIGRFTFVWAAERTFDPDWGIPANNTLAGSNTSNNDSNSANTDNCSPAAGQHNVDDTQQQQQQQQEQQLPPLIVLVDSSGPQRCGGADDRDSSGSSTDPSRREGKKPATIISVEYVCAMVFSLSLLFYTATLLARASAANRDYLGYPALVREPWWILKKLFGAVGQDCGADQQWLGYESFVPFLTALAALTAWATRFIRRCQAERAARVHASSPSQHLSSHSATLSDRMRHLCGHRNALAVFYAMEGFCFSSIAHNTHVVFPLVIVTCNYLVFTALQRWRRCPYWLFMLLMWATHVGVMCANEYFQGYEYFYWVQRLLPTMEGSALLFGVEYKPLIPRLMRWHIAYRMYVLRMISFNYDMWEANRNAGAARERALQKHLLTCIDCAKLRECREKHGEQHHPYVSESGKRRETKHFFPMGFLSPRSQDSRALPTPMESTAVAVGWEKRWDESIGSSTRAAVGDDSCHTVPVSIYTGVPDAAFPSPLASLASINSMTSPRTKGAAFSSSPLAASHPPSFPATATANSIGMASADRVVDGGNSNGNGNTTLSDLASDESCWCYKLRTDYPRDTAQYTFVHYLAYLLFVPTLLCGPISSFNAFVSYMRSPSLAMPRRDKYLYALRIVFIYAVMIALQHTIFVNAFSMQIHLVQEMPAQAQGAYLYFYLAFLYLKFNFIWKTSRLFAMWSGIEVPENIIRCYANTCFTRDFWRSWHASFNLWIVRYMYIPMGGRKRLLFSIFPIFFFIAIWHDHVLHLLMWAFLICLVIAAETIIGGLYGKLASAFSREMEKGKEAEEDSQRGPVDGNSNRKSNVNGLNVWRAAACFARTRMTRCQRWYVQRVLVGCSGALAIGAQILVNVIGYSYQTDYTFNKENMAEEGMNSQGTIRRVLGLVRENAILCVVTFFYFYAVATMGALYMKKQSVAQRQDKARYGLQ